jgi:hypothetical protein
MKLEDVDQTSFWSEATKCMSLNREVLDLLEGILRMFNPCHRGWLSSHDVQ